MGKTQSIKTILSTKYVMFGFGDEVKNMIGDAGKGFTILIYGKSGNGKSTFVTILCKLLCRYGKVYYNSVESGIGLVIQKMAIHTNLHEVGELFTVGDRDSYEDMLEKLEKNRAVFVVIDSLQAMRLQLTQWEELKRKFKNKCFIVISWEGGGEEPKGEHAKAIKFYSDIKIRVSKGLALIDSRFGNTEPYRVPAVYDKFQKADEAERQRKADKTNPKIEIKAQQQLFQKQ